MLSSMCPVNVKEESAAPQRDAGGPWLYPGAADASCGEVGENFHERARTDSVDGIVKLLGVECGLARRSRAVVYCLTCWDHLRRHTESSVLMNRYSVQPRWFAAWTGFPCACGSASTDAYPWCCRNHDITSPVCRRHKDAYKLLRSNNP